MRLIALNESLYSDLVFDYDYRTKSYVARTGREIIRITQGPEAIKSLRDTFSVTIENNSGTLFKCINLKLDDKELDDDVFDTVASLISSVYSEIVDVNSLSDMYDAADKFNNLLANKLYDAF